MGVFVRYSYIMVPSDDCFDETGRLTETIRPPGESRWGSSSIKKRREIRWIFAR